MAIDNAVQLEFEFVRELDQRYTRNNLNELLGIGAAITAATVLPKLYDYLQIPEKLGSFLAQAEDYIMHMYF